MVEARHDLEQIMRHTVDCGFIIHNEVGPGLLEAAYEAFLAALLRERGFQVETQRSIAVTYRGVVIRDAFRADLMVEHRLIVEIKSVARLAPIHSKQLLTYLRLTEQPLGLLINFGAELYRDGVKRVINNRSDYVAPIPPQTSSSSSSS